MKIVFTGHRNCRTDEAELQELLVKYPNSIWVHGGANGFDNQVGKFALANGIHVIEKRPDYATHGKHAPLTRNRLMVDMPDVQLVVACYDGRESGGTLYTINYAKRKAIPVEYVSAINCITRIVQR